MIKIELQAETPQELLAKISDLQAFLSCSTLTPAMPSPAAPAIPAPAPIATPTAPTPAPAPAPAPTVPAPAPAPAPAMPQMVPTAPPPTYTLDQIAHAGAALVDAGKMAELVALLEKFGAEAVTQIPAASYGAFATELRALGAQI